MPVIRNILTIAFCCFTFVAVAQTTDPAFPDEIRTSRLATQVNIPGTKVFIVPPAGFKISSRLPAIEKGNTAMVQVMDLDGGNYYTNAAEFTRNNFEKKGIKVLEFKELMVNKFPAKIAFLQGGDQTKVYDLVFGDTTFSTMIMGVFPASDAEAGEQVKQALLSVYYDKAKKIDPFAAARFRLDDSRSIFKFAKFAASVYMYSIGGVKKESYNNEPYFMAIALPTEGKSVRTIADEMVNTLKNSTIKNVSENKTNGFPALKREVYADMNGKPVVLYQHVVSMGEITVAMMGVADSNIEKYIAEFEKLSNTVNKK